MSAPIRRLAARMEAESMRARLHGSPENSNVDSSNWRCRWRRARLLWGGTRKAWFQRFPRLRPASNSRLGWAGSTAGSGGRLEEGANFLKNLLDQKFMGT